MGGLDGCDPAMLQLFRDELDTHLPVLSQGLLDLEKGRAGERDIEAMMRAAHSIKGAARIVGVEAAVRVAHGMEDCFSAAQGHRIALSSEAVDVLLQGVDALQRICSPQAEPAMTEPSIQALLDQITAIRDGRSSPPARDAPVPSAADPPAAHSRPVPEPRLTLPAVLDASAADSLRRELSDFLGSPSSRIRFDFAQVRHLSAAALSLFVSFAREAARARPALTVEAENVSAAMAVLLRITGLDRTFTRRRGS